MLRLYSLKAKETDYTDRMLKSLNKEMSPFLDDETKDSMLARDLLDKYRVAEEFDVVTTQKQIKRETHKVHAYLKTIESGEGHNDTRLLSQVNEGLLDPQDPQVKKYLTKRYHVVKGRFTGATY